MPHSAPLEDGQFYCKLTVDDFPKSGCGLDFLFKEQKVALKEVVPTEVSGMGSRGRGAGEHARAGRAPRATDLENAAPDKWPLGVELVKGAALAGETAHLEETTGLLGRFKVIFDGITADTDS